MKSHAQEEPDWYPVSIATPLFLFHDTDKVLLFGLKSKTSGRRFGKHRQLGYVLIKDQCKRRMHFSIYKKQQQLICSRG
jgi:hypothetical protein